MQIFLLAVTFVTIITVVCATYGVDVSQRISTEAFQCLKRRGFKFAIVRGFRSSGRPDYNAVRTIRNAKAAGFRYVDVYMFPCYKCGNPERQLKSMLNALTPVDSEYGMIWIDIEGSRYWSQNEASNLNFIKALYNEVQAHTSHKVGIYSSHANWHQLTGNSGHFGNRVPIWYAHYDRKPDFSDWNRWSFGAWYRPSIKQYQGDASECGVGIDKNWYP